ncbi:NADH-ubiquinone oxidoreductase [Aaosphaeria arxii CBS 175.79]|uniref:NADH-ubiquinone oxidoreductase n=1 Tax=Aaosphaeria arxii CBS 175.79 TaxID=1450172 RepID=A0A6A5Y8X7_9PLEO|nr:NADH-ubiquinone oxidoreductase [Aaosphaeria arxii CBS 175.79]KAF2021270.1 NADH-ubiquinone oxidoreductase [Aaosphaeria arxii CBS 175.79]
MFARTFLQRAPLRTAPTIFRAAYSSGSTPPQKAGQTPANDPAPQEPKPNVSATNELPKSSNGAFDQTLQESVAQGEQLRVQQAPNRHGIWTRNQQPREVAMTGPRFEQTTFADQPQPHAAIDLIHKQPVRWTHDRVVSCDGGGGPLGHPKIFINTDKPKICWCTYCGIPFANEHHRKHLESLPETSYPLGPSGDAAEVNESQRVTDEPLGQR